MRKCFVYMLRCSDGTIYTGWTSDPERRLRRHNSGSGSKYTAARLPVEMVYVERAPSRPAALRRELKIKSMSRASKLRLIASGAVPSWHSRR